MENLFTTLNDLPMNEVLVDILAHIDTGGVALVVSATGSGKTLLTPAAIYADTGESVLICEPSRFLTMNAASIIADLTNTKLGEIAGYLVGIRGRETMPTVHRNTPLIFETYGMSLASQSILEAENIVLDEVHDPQMDITIVSAIVKARMQSNGAPLKRLVIMSATMDVDEKLAYWKDFNPRVFSIETGRLFKCKLMWEPATPPHGAVVKLIEHDHKGILVFAPGVGEILSVASDLFNTLEQKRAADKTWYAGWNFEILQLHGGSEYEDRIRANSKPAPNVIRVLIGTNVMESGVSFSWVDAGVSMGLTKEMHVARESGATALQTVPLTRSSLQQQTGRTNRFCDSTFILCGHMSPEKMVASPTPEIMRVPLTALHMHCATIGVNPSELEFSPSPDPEKFKEAVVTLQHLGFLDAKHELTAAGEFAQQLPVGLETAALLWQAKQLDILPQALRLAVVFEVGGIRKDLTMSHYLNHTSDYLDGMVAYAKAELLQESRFITHVERVETMLSNNIGKKKYDVAKDVLVALERVLDISTDKNSAEELLPHNRTPEQELLFDKLRLCLLAATIDKLGSHWMGQISIGGGIMPYGVGNSCGVRFDYGAAPVSAGLRRIYPRDKMKLPFTISEQITLFKLQDFVVFNEVRPGVISTHVDMFDRLELRAFGKPFGWFQDREGVFQNMTTTTTMSDAMRKVGADVVKPASTREVLNRLVALESSVKPATRSVPPVAEPGTMYDQLLALKNKFKGS